MKFRLLLLVFVGLASAHYNDEEKTCQTPVRVEDPYCETAVRKWAFNTTSQQCERFVLSECKLGSSVRSLYDFKHECMSNCDKSNPLLQVDGPPTDLCFYPPTKGIYQCFATYKEMWTFDASSPGGPRCVGYIYGGCLASENLFRTEKECLTTCENAITKIVNECPVRESVTSCDKFCSGDRDCDESEVCCPSLDPECRAQCVPAVISSPAENKNLVTVERTKLTLKTRAICEQHVENGPCFLAMKKFAFKPEKNRCEVFLYGGCQGNDNKFDSASECQNTCGGDIPNEDVTCASVQCDTNSIRQYKDRNCIPQYAKGACCPTSYYCDDNAQVASSEPEPQTCFHKGHSYHVGVNISAITEDDSCLTCQCSPSPPPLPPSISCSKQTCPVEDAPSTECVLVTVPGQCCPIWKCETESVVTCKVNNQTYQEGDIFYTTPCRKCICTAHYTRKNDYGCSEEVCIQQPPSLDCVPVYKTGVCCPVDFHCPAIEISVNETAQSTTTSKPGQMLFNMGRPFNQSSCLLPPIKGKCRASFRMYYYDAASQACKRFTYGGCGGNGNHFLEEISCQELCAGVTLSEQSPQPTIDAKAAVEDVCIQPKVEGPCQSSIPSVYYDSTKGSCERFLYGGCKGNGNRFNTLQECQTQCTKPAEPNEKNPPFCNLTAQAGKCRASFRRFFFNSTSQKCETFTYGGCGGNENRFKSLQECKAMCKSTMPHEVKIPDYCSLPGEPGPCQAYKPRFFHDSLTGQCKQFTYGGCEGNLNRFYTEDECEDTCKPEVQPVVVLEATTNTTMSTSQDSSTNTTNAHCALPPDQGFCLAFRNRFYYNPETSKCEQFVYGGCKGNANNFRTEQQCMNSCGKQSNEPVILPEESVCRFGNITVNRGDRLPTAKLCLDCMCVTPPDITCSLTECQETSTEHSPNVLN